MQEKTIRSAEGPLSHVSVLDFTHQIAGPYCTKLLADFGAKVVKVERPGGGDAARRFGPFPGDTPDSEKSGTFLYLNGNKLGITLDLKSRTGARIARKLAQTADLVVENFRPGVMGRLGLDYQALKQENPHLAMISISNFGQTGPYRDYRATEIVAQAMGGIMYVTGFNDREPLKEALSQAQLWTGIMGATAALVGLNVARTTGQGDYIDLSIQESIASGLQSTLGFYSYMGAERRRQNWFPGGLNYPYPCKDGYIVPAASGTWDEFANCLETPELIQPRLATHFGRLKNVEELNRILVGRFQRSGKHELFHRGQEWGFPFGVAQTPEELASCPQLASRDFWVTADHPIAGTWRYPGSPCHMDESPWRMRSPAPTIGQHNEQVLCGSLGFSKADIISLRRTGVI